MAAITLVEAGKIRVVESLEQATVPANAAGEISEGIAVTIDGTTGRWVQAGAAGPGYGIAVDRQQIGVTAIRNGVLDGFDLSGMSYGDPVYLGATGTIDTAGTVKVGFVIAGTSNLAGAGHDKLLKVDMAGV